MKNAARIALLLGAGMLAAGQKVSPDFPGQSSAPGSTFGFMSPGSFVNVDAVIQFNGRFSSFLSQLASYGSVKRSFNSTNSVVLTLPAFAVKTLAAMGFVKYISPNRGVKGALDITTATVNANVAWSSGYNGSGIGVAVLDSGVSPKDDLMASDKIHSRIVYSQSFVDADSSTGDAYGHGTHVAGILGSNGVDSTGSGFTRTFQGVAPNVNIVNLRVLDRNGSGTDADVIAGINQAIALKNTYNIRVINLSLGRPVFESYTLDPLCQAVEAAWQAGIVVVAAAGNYGRDNTYGESGYGTIVAPGNDPYVITVGATNAKGTNYRSDDVMASYSSKGPTPIDHFVKPDLVAPGNAVVSELASDSDTLAVNYPGQKIGMNYFQSGNPNGTSLNYFRLSGTSMATPVVSGAAALLLQKTPSLTPDQVKARLMKTAGKGQLPPVSTGVDIHTYVHYNLQADIFTVGAGYLDINAALANTDLVSMPAMSASAFYDSGSRHASIIRNFSVIWGDSVVWGDLALYGTAVFNGRLPSGTSVIWGDSVVWGDSTNGGFSVVWGDAFGGAGLTALASSDSDQ